MAAFDLPRPSFMQDEEIALFEASVDRFFDENAGSSVRERWREQGFVEQDFWGKAGEAGMLCSHIPEAYGGMAADFL